MGPTGTEHQQPSHSSLLPSFPDQLPSIKSALDLPFHLQSSPRPTFHIFFSLEMSYGRLGAPEPIPSLSERPFQNDRHPKREHRRFHRCLFASGIFFASLLVAGAAAAAILSGFTGEDGGGAASLPTIHGTSKAISKACGITRFQDLCVSSLHKFPGAVKAGELDLVHVSVKVTLQRVSAALYGASSMASARMDTLLKTAYEDCMELLDDSIAHLSRSLAVITQRNGGSYADVLTWLSASLTNHDTCEEGLAGAGDSYVKDQMLGHMRDLSELVSNSLAIFATISKNKDFAGIPIENRRRLMSSERSAGEFPSWVSRKERRLLQAPAVTIPADIVVSKDGNGTFKTIEEAVNAAPEFSPRKFIIYIKAGRWVLSTPRFSVDRIGEDRNSFIGLISSIIASVCSRECDDFVGDINRERARSHAWLSDFFAADVFTRTCASQGIYQKSLNLTGCCR